MESQQIAFEKYAIERLHLKQSLLNAFLKRNTNTALHSSLHLILCPTVYFFIFMKYSPQNQINTVQYDASSSLFLSLSVLYRVKDIF